MAKSQRGRLLSAVIETVAARGYDNTRVADVIAAAGVSRKSFYEHFQEKEDCFLAAYELELARLTETTISAFAEEQANWASQVRAGVRGLLAYLAANPQAARVCIVEVMGAGPKAIDRRAAALARFTHLIDAGRSSSTQEIPPRTALAVIGAINELLASALIHGSADRLEEMAPDVTYLVCLPFLGPKRALAERAISLRELRGD